ncbi:type III pantothenate kinase [Entomoplasma ellychniae]|uniref:Type III pantothenate kinase n=1 Tax=Entomoplasma ellychniae TaxID=2114 RepID=A0A8E2QVD6_9MOLU|nr:type III pantothenate kinase [Entomoplasma ellychniae]PPE04372.1 type III pantothenate kinase [Entomoplasma ellychniae]
MIKLLIDVGNTTTHCKWYDSQNNCFIKETIFMTKNVLQDETKVVFESHYDQLIYSSVVKKIEEKIKQKENKAYSIFDFKKISQNDFVYPIDQLGQDFIANFYGWKTSNGIIVSLGTATTFMIIKDSKMIGAIISPGIESSFKGLIDSADALEFNFYQEVKWENNTKGLWTKQAINKGVVNGHWYMIKGLIKEIKKEHNIKDVILTGGYADLLIQNKYNVNKNLIFEGIINISS